MAAAADTPKTQALKEAMAALEHQLEERPDQWFDQPQGWLSKPDFKRAEQDLASYATGSYKGKSSMMASMMGKKSFTKRFFVLESSSLKYYREMTSDTPAGAVRLEDVLEITASIVPDADKYSFDLRTADRIFTLSAESNEMMVKWALAVSQAIGNKGEGGTRAAGASGEVNWQRFDQTFEVKQPLLLNVKGV
eukprot:CAMPEP_0119487950 /NCGR_PEP_ID=MMETSP1344-20130328/13878_1 /TAXON_ID=236787 /ORGANISM="Florenciella parvula, Strain CCMP2471" /LENGTH=192 /DNA_ID=CAMNT_0007522855 /DNA_START=57 /DNA_END=631 /DNA_ORIENTATION=+